MQSLECVKCPPHKFHEQGRCHLSKKMLTKLRSFANPGTNSPRNIKLGCSNAEMVRSTTTYEGFDEDPSGVGRRCGGYEPSIWGDYFLTCAPPPMQKSEKWIEQRAAQLKEEVRKMLRNATDNVEMMHLIETIEHLGIGYQFYNEIEDALSKLHDAKFENLHHMALRFRLLRLHGYFISADEFCKFKDGESFDGKLSDDVRGLLSLYNAGYLAIPGESILDEAVSFARDHLMSKVDDLKSPSKEQVVRALKTPLYRMIPRVETRFYIEEYEEEEKRIDKLLELAKIDFNIVQRIYFDEMKNLAGWWKQVKQLNIEENLRYGRDRIAELHLFGISVYFEPQYSRARIMLAKLFALTTVMDDGYDIFGTFEECKLLNDAIQRWTEEAAACVPTYLRRLYLSLLSTVKSLEDELLASEKYRIPYVVKSIQTLSNSYFKEVKWHANRQIPTFGEYIKESADGNAVFYVVCGPYVGMGEEAVTEEVFRWLNGIPKIVQDCGRIGRFIEDVASYEREKKAGQWPNAFECYMIEHSLTKEEAAEKFYVLIEDSWKRLNQAYLRPTKFPKTILEPLVNFDRAMVVMYQYYDNGFNKSSQLKELIASLLLQPFSL